MRIGFLQTSFSASSIGGGEHHTEELALCLQELGHDVVIHTNEPKERRDITDRLNIVEHSTLLRVNPINELSLARRAASMLSSCDVVVLTDESGWFGVDLPVPTVTVFHLVWAGWISRQGPRWRLMFEKPQANLYAWMQRKICQRTTAIVSISQNIREDIDRLGDYDEKIWRIPNGVDIDRFTPGAKADTFTVHFQGRLVGMKQPGRLVEAVAESREDWRLTIGGDGPLREALEERVDDLGVRNRVEILGFVSERELPEQYARSHIFALPSRYEGMPLTVLEAAASGTAVVASPRAATDFVTEEMGRVVDPTPQPLARTIDELALSPESTIEMGRQARERAEQYSWSSIAEQYESLFAELVQ